MHNSGLEVKNGAIKLIATDYKQMSVTDFCMAISKFIQAESLEKDPNPVTIAHICEILKSNASPILQLPMPSIRNVISYTKL